MAVALRIAPGPAVAEGDVEHPVPAKGDRAAVMVRKRLLDLEEDPLAPRVDDVAVERHRERRHDGVPVEVGVVDEDAAVGRVVRVERQAQEAALAAGADTVRDVEEGRLVAHAVADGLDPADLLDDEQPLAAVVGGRDIDREIEPVRDQVEPDRPCRARRGSVWAQASRSAAPATV